MRWSGKVLTLVLLILIVLLSAANSQQVSSESVQQNSTPSYSGKSTADDERGTDKAPLAVKLLNTGKSPAETAQEAQQLQAEYDSEWWVRVLTGALVGVGLLQLFAYVLQAKRLKQTIGVMHDYCRTAAEGLCVGHPKSPF